MGEVVYDFAAPPQIVRNKTKFGSSVNDEYTNDNAVEGQNTRI